MPKSALARSRTQSWLLLLTVTLSGAAGFVGCSGKVKDMGQQAGFGAAHGAGASGGALPGTSISGATGMASSPCGATACVSYTGPKTFLEPGVPADAPSTFAGGTLHAPGTEHSREPGVIYPANETMFPLNVSHIRHEWSGQGNDLFRLTFTGPNTTVTVYTSSLDWTPTDEEWDWIAESNRGAATQFAVSALSTASPGDIWSSAPITELFSDAAVDGAIYYWSTGSKGVMRALVSDPLPQKFYTDPQASDSDTCVACHTVSRDGKRLAVGYGDETLREVSIPDRSVLIPNAATAGGAGNTANTAGAGGMPAGMMMPKPPPDKGMPKPPMGAEGGIPAAWSTFSPDGKLLLIAKSGVLTLLDSDTGKTVGDNSGVVPLPTGVIATHPDWNAKGDLIAITLGTKGGNKEVQGGAIALLPYNAGKWGDPMALVPNSGGDDNNFFPVWSPDGKYIAFVNAIGNSNNATSAVLKLVVVADGNVKQLVRLNERVNDLDGVLSIGNTMPTWAPSSNPGIFWLAFSSLRAYGTLRPQDKKTDQIWIAAIDPSQKDPSYSGFWAPFQSIEEGNHRAFWSHSSEDTQCRCVDICGDDLDNDCDGVADGKGCSTCIGSEICGDGIDNNCDCVVDNCNVEICGNGSDDDGDGLIDTEDPACVVK